MVSNHNDASAKIILSEDGKEYLAPLLPVIRKRMTDKIKDSWFAPAYSMEWLSPWRRDHDLWRIWVTLHFMPLRRTQRDEWRKNDMKKIMKCLHFQPDGFLERGLWSLRESNFLTETITGVLPAKICWSAWRKSQRKAILSTWNSKRREENKVADLLCQIPVEQWLNMDKVITWLKAASKNTLPGFPWDRFFFRSSVKDLIRFNKEEDCIYLPPMFRAVLADKAFALPSPGWKGAGSLAAHAGFITAAGDIQLPPEFSHQTLKKMASFCTLTKVEHMIELRLNTAAIDPIDPNQKALAECISILESIQSPLPQAVAYELDHLP